MKFIERFLDLCVIQFLFNNHEKKINESRFKKNINFFENPRIYISDDI